MAKVALLIGVSEYKDDFARLPAATKDIEAMEGVLNNPKIGDFDHIRKLANPDVQSMREEIETLFSDLQKDDLVLLYFSGHGIKDDSGNLFFASCGTRKNNQGKFLTSTAVQASFVHNIMDRSRSKRQVLILDCCFSGAFANGLNAKSDQFVDIKNQLGGEGRAILTSSTSTQYSFEEQGSDISTYTRYIVEGLETGAADRDEDAWISVDELHEYARTKVQEVAPAMKPEIYAIKEGYKIKLAQAPIDNPKLIYRKEVEYWAKMGEGKISNTGYIALEELIEKLELKPEVADRIQLEVLEPYRINHKKLKLYQEAYSNAIEHDFPLNNRTRTELKRLQEVLGLRDEDVALIEKKISKDQEIIPLIISKFPKWLVLLFIIFSLATITLMVTTFTSQHNKLLDKNISLGENILFKQDINSNKTDGVKEFAKSNFNVAVKSFRKSLANNPDDPEALIYKNNALAAANSTTTLKIAVSVPIGTNPTVAKEILRGVAQRQNEINLKGGINANKPLQVLIANDNNDEKKLVRSIAKQLVKNTDILAVVGHNSSDASIAGNQVYSGTELVAITPTSDSGTVKENDILHTMPNSIIYARKLIEHLKNKGLTKIAICYDSESKASINLKGHFEGSIVENVTPKMGCDLKKWDLEDNLPQAIKESEAQALVLLPNVNHINRAIEMAKIAKRQGLTLLGSPTMNTPEILKENGSVLDGILVPIPWDPEQNLANYFIKNAQKLWGKQNWHPNWRTAMAYDATDAIVKGLEKKQNRSTLKNILKQSNFSINGVTGIINFSKGGDGSRVTLLQVKAKQTTVYEFEKVN